MGKKRFRIDRQLRQEVKRLPCVLCTPGRQMTPTDPCHVKTFGSSGIEEWWNMVPMCREHHNSQHQLGWRRFLAAFPKMDALLRELGWEFLECNGQFKLFNKKEMEK